MKRTFTFISMALAFMAGYAQSSTTGSNDEEWAVVNADGTLKSIYVANSDANAMSVVKFSTTNVEGTHTSGPVAGYTDAPLNADKKLEPKVDNTWGGVQKKTLSSDESVPSIYYVCGKGNPVNLDKVTFDPITDQDGVASGNYRANWEASYYAPDGSAGLPQNGTYITLTPKVAGTMIAYVWVNKGSRDVYIAKQSDAKALAFGTDITVSGYINGQNNDVEDGSPLKGYMKYQEEISMKGTEGADAYVIGAGTQPVWAGLTFEAEANETYYVFAKSTQIGFAGFVFTPSDASGISDVTVSGNSQKAVRYNISGQKVDASYKGLVIENGKKFVQK